MSWKIVACFRVICLLKYIKKKASLFTCRKLYLTLEKKCQWMNEWWAKPVYIVRFADVETTWLCHVCHMKGLVCVTFSLSALCSTLLAQLCKDFWLVLCTKPGYNNNFLLCCQNHVTAAREYKGTQFYRNAMRQQIFFFGSIKGNRYRNV